MDVYSTDDDLVAIRSNILLLGVDDWEQKHIDAKIYIDKIIESQWYRTTALDNGIDYLETVFNADLLSDSGSQLKLLSCYKTLELIYVDLMKDTQEEDGFERHSKFFGKLFDKELKNVLSIGLDYDWNLSGSISSDERQQPKKRRLRRS